jgi:hypothetical protein
VIVDKRDFLEIVSGKQPDRMGFVHLSELDGTRLIVYARKLLAVQVQAQKLFWESDAAVDTPARAALALALHDADPAAFQFPRCVCGRYPLTACPPKGCARSIWVAQLQSTARSPHRRHRWWHFWRRRWP